MTRERQETMMYMLEDVKKLDQAGALAMIAECSYVEDIFETNYKFCVAGDAVHELITRSGDIESNVTTHLPDGSVGFKVIPECGYCFHRAVSGKLYIKRVTMHPKTAANYRRGSERYGEAKIMKEVMNDERN